MNPSTPPNTDATQADALARLVELEARWGNVPLAVATDSASASLAGLVAKQKAFDAYRAQLVSYNQRFRPVYDGQRPVNSPVRLAAWCRTMADLYRRAGRAECPASLLEQAHRCADRLATRLGREGVSRPGPVTTIAEAIAGLGAIAEWCDGLIAATATSPMPTAALEPQVVAG